MKFAYADPPYLGCGKLYAKYHENALDWDKPDRHRRLINQLCAEYPDGWALSLSSPSMKVILPMCPDDIKLAAWLRPNSAPFYPVRVIKSWEPVIYRGGRQLFDNQLETAHDCLLAPVVLKGLVGAKPRKFCRWIFSLLGAMAGDEMDDLFPGTGAVSMAWNDWIFEQTAQQEMAI